MALASKLTYSLSITRTLSFTRTLSIKRTLSMTCTLSFTRTLSFTLTGYHTALVPKTLWPREIQQQDSLLLLLSLWQVFLLHCHSTHRLTGFPTLTACCTQVGGQSSGGYDTDFKTIAQGCGYKWTQSVSTYAELTEVTACLIQHRRLSARHYHADICVFLGIEKSQNCPRTILLGDPGKSAATALLTCDKLAATPVPACAVYLLWHMCSRFVGSLC